MYFDAFTISALVDELRDVLVGGRIQDSVSVDQTGLGLEIYAHHRRCYLYMSADHHAPRVHLVEDKLRRGLTTPTPLGLLFRRYVEGGVISRVSQPEWERVLQIDVQGPEGEVAIIVEPMERRSNILLVQGGVILDCMRRVGPEENRYRLSLPAHQYVPPPRQVGKVSPQKMTLETMIGILDGNDDPRRKTHQILASRILGISPLLAKEVVFRSGADVGQRAADADPEGLLAALHVVIEPLIQRQWQPGIIQTEKGVEAFSVYPLHSMAGWRPVETASQAVAAFYGAPIGPEAYEAAKKPVREMLREAQNKLRAKLSSLERSITDREERETLRQSGELILTYQHTLKKGQTEFKAQYDADEPARVIKLDPELSPLENAQSYFNRYNKAKRALEDVPGLIEAARNELRYLEQLATDLELAVSWPEIDEVRQALQAKGHWRGKTTRRMGGQSAPLRLATPDGYVIWVGRNSRQNEIVTFKHSGSEDLWLHARDVPGAHVVIRFDGRRIPDSVIERAASIAAYYSANRDEKSVLVDVTKRKYVRKIKGAGPGMVTYRNEESRAVAPRSEADWQ